LGRRYPNSLNRTAKIGYGDQCLGDCKGVAYIEATEAIASVKKIMDKHSTLRYL